MCTVTWGLGVQWGGGGKLAKGQFRRGQFRKGKILPPPGILKLAVTSLMVGSPPPGIPLHMSQFTALPCI